MTVRILLVDDHELMRQGLRSILEKEPEFEVVGEAANGREAVQAAAALRPDLVVMDVVMKDLNGIEATARIREAHERVQVVALSSHADPRYVTAILRAGASAYVMKSNAYDELRRAVRAALCGRSYLCAEVAGVVVENVRAADPAAGSAYQVLTAREREVLQLVAEGLSAPQIAVRLHVSVHTVEAHRKSLARKLTFRSVAELTKYAIREGLTSADD